MLLPFVLMDECMVDKKNEDLYHTIGQSKIPCYSAWFKNIS